MARVMSTTLFVKSVRVSASRVVQRTVLHLGELNTTQMERWQRTIEVLHEDGQRRQLRLFTDREAQAPSEADVVEVRLSSLQVKQPRRFGDCWVGTQLWEQLGLRAFWEEALGPEVGQVPWHKVLELLAGPWQQISEQVEVQLVGQDQEVYVLCRSRGRQKKEAAMHQRLLRGLMRSLIKLRRRLRRGRIKNEVLLHRLLGRLHERYSTMWKYARVKTSGLELSWDWDRELLRLAVQREGAYLLRAHWTEKDPARLWQTYVQLAEAEAAFRVLKSEVKIRPIWHWLERRVEAHVLVAFLGYCLWVCLKHRLKAVAPSLTPWQALDQLGRISLVEVWFELKDGRHLCLPRITQPEPTQAVLLEQLNWHLPKQPPPRIYAHQVPVLATGSRMDCVADSEV